MSTDTNSSMQMDNVVPPNTNHDGTTDYHRLPPISEKTQRELQASAEYFMRTYGKQNNAMQQQGTGGSPSGSSPSSTLPVNANNTNSRKSSQKNGDVDMKPPETGAESDKGKDDSKSS